MPDRLRPSWDFDDLEASQVSLRAALAREATASGRAEVMTQLARLAGLRERFGEGHKLLDEARDLAGDSTAVAIRLDLERGRLFRSGGDGAAGLPLFESAFQRAVTAGDDFLAADAAHMAALAAGGRQAFLNWTQRGLAIATAATDPADRYWAGPLLNNLGWELAEAASMWLHWTPSSRRWRSVFAFPIGSARSAWPGRRSPKLSAPWDAKRRPARCWLLTPAAEEPGGGRARRRAGQPRP